MKQDSVCFFFYSLPSFFSLLLLLLLLGIICSHFRFSTKTRLVFLNRRCRGENQASLVRSCSDVHHYLNISSSSEQMNVAEHQGVCSPAHFFLSQPQFPHPSVPSGRTAQHQPAGDLCCCLRLTPRGVGE